MTYATLREKIAAEKVERAARYAGFRDLLERARAAGREAGETARPEPMAVADGFTGQLVEIVAGGPCGFAWVTIRPGGSSFARWLVANGYGRKAYYGGVQVWIGDYGQSIARKYAHACAMADTFRAAGIDATAGSRLD